MSSHTTALSLAKRHEEHRRPGYKKVLSSSKLLTFLGNQADKLEGPKVFLLEVFAGKEARLSLEAERAGKSVIRIGLHWGKDVSKRESMNMLVELVCFVKPEHVFVAWQDPA